MSSMDIRIKTFDQLDVHELYAILALRSAVFVVEQECAYQDPDGKDPLALHVMGFHANQLVAYTRIFEAGVYAEHTSIGRVVVGPKARGRKLGYQIMEASLNAISERWGAEIVEVSAQAYLETFYNNLGFQGVGDGYLEDGIPHLRMIKS